MFRLFFGMQYASDALAFKKCIKKPIVDTSYEGPSTHDSNRYCDSEFERTVPKDIRCQLMFEKCRNTPIIDSSYEGSGQEIDNSNYCQAEWNQCIRR